MVDFAEQRKHENKKKLNQLMDKLHRLEEGLKIEFLSRSLDACNDTVNNCLSKSYGSRSGETQKTCRICETQPSSSYTQSNRSSQPKSSPYHPASSPGTEHSCKTLIPNSYGKVTGDDHCRRQDAWKSSPGFSRGNTRSASSSALWGRKPRACDSRKGTRNVVADRIYRDEVYLDHIPSFDDSPVLRSQTSWFRHMENDGQDTDSSVVLGSTRTPARRHLREANSLANIQNDRGIDQLKSRRSLFGDFNDDSSVEQQHVNHNRMANNTPERKVFSTPKPTFNQSNRGKVFDGATKSSPNFGDLYYRLEKENQNPVNVPQRIPCAPDYNLQPLIREPYPDLRAMQRGDPLRDSNPNSAYNPVNTSQQLNNMVSSSRLQQLNQDFTQSKANLGQSILSRSQGTNFHQAHVSEQSLYARGHTGSTRKSHDNAEMIRSPELNSVEDSNVYGRPPFPASPRLGVVHPSFPDGNPNLSRSNHNFVGSHQTVFNANLLGSHCRSGFNLSHGSPSLHASNVTHPMYMADPIYNEVDVVRRGYVLEEEEGSIILEPPAIEHTRTNYEHPIDPFPHSQHHHHRFDHHHDSRPQPRVIQNSDMSNSHYHLHPANVAINVQQTQPNNIQHTPLQQIQPPQLHAVTDERRNESLLHAIRKLNDIPDTRPIESMIDQHIKYPMCPVLPTDQYSTHQQVPLFSKDHVRDPVVFHNSNYSNHSNCQRHVSKYDNSNYARSDGLIQIVSSHPGRLIDPGED